MGNLTADDKIAIAELIARFAHCSDYADWAALEKLYVPEIETELDGLAISYQGIPAQIAHAQESAAQTAGKNRHYNFNLYIEERAGAVVAQYCFLNVNAGAKALTAQMVTSGRMSDTVVKTADGWKIARRFVRFDQSFELDF
ncbi:SnoaL-like domain-containing protein [Sphingomonas laterariae]|uniref:SnoaL-like domain-containing protein n=1 Tax=Edaphosphingomonas laterariae TaxID=861865 RepID=A0A239DGV8_9SPHN|nr:nuclear transport factor 2 family protein [Sphingomonas laterariae]SNS31038.1 SnoaL-like domain-containing protein [Sphingomonas laterariae]